MPSSIRNALNKLVIINVDDRHTHPHKVFLTIGKSTTICGEEPGMFGKYRIHTIILARGHRVIIGCETLNVTSVYCKLVGKRHSNAFTVILALESHATTAERRDHNVTLCSNIG